MHVFVIIPVHDHVRETLRCLECLARQTHRQCICIVVDGGSTDGTPEKLAQAHPDVAVVRGTDSLWWTGATALGVEHARKLAKPGDFILFLNNDTQVESDYLEQLVAASVAHDRALIGSLNVALDDPTRIIDSGVWWDWRRVQSWQVPIEPGASCTTGINTLSGRGMLVPVEVFDRVGNVNVKSLPHYAADYEFAMRAGRAGFPLALSYRAMVKVNTGISGREGDLATPFPLRETLFLLFSRRSMRNVWDRLRFVRLACPGRYRPRNYFAVLAAAAWLLTNVPPVFQIKNLLLGILLPTGLTGLTGWMRARKLIP